MSKSGRHTVPSIKRVRQQSAPPGEISQLSQAANDSPVTLQPTGKWIAGLRAEMRLSDAVEQCFRQRWRAVLYYLPLAVERADDDAEFVHQLRVSSRRLDAVLKVFPRHFAEEPRSTLESLNDQVRRACGKARDLDVEHEMVAERLKKAEAREAMGLTALREHLEQRRAKAQKKLRRKLLGLGWELQLGGEQTLLSLHRVGDVPPDVGAEARGPFLTAGCRMLRDEFARIWDLGSHDLDDPEALHALRIACKQARYALELFIPVLPPCFARDYYSRFQHIQELLGTVHDSWQAVASLRDLELAWHDKGVRLAAENRRLAWSDVKHGLRSMIQFHARQEREARDEFSQLWPEFASRDFRQPIEKSLKDLEDQSEAERRKVGSPKPAARPKKSRTRPPGRS